MQREFQIVPASAGTRWFVAGLGIVLVVLSLFLMVTRPVKSGVVSTVALWLGAALLFYTAKSMGHVEFILSPGFLRIRRDLFGRAVRRSDLRASEARLMSLYADPDHRPVLRTFGTGLPGYLSGWFRLRNREKALIFVTDATRVVYMPTTRGYSLLLSVQRPEEFLQALRVE